MEEKKQNLEEKGHLRHDFDYLLILDFEATCSNTEKMLVQEIIEFPVVVLDLATNEISKLEFHTYIKPTVHPVLSEFCTELTKITQKQVDDGIILQDALQNLEQFLKNMGIYEKKFAFVCCGDFDIGKCLRVEAKYKKIEIPDYFKQYINIKKQFPVEWYTENIKKWNKPPGMVAMLNALKMELQGTHHSGIDDSRNIARIAQYMVSKNIYFTKDMLVQVIEEKKKEKLSKKEKKNRKQNIEQEKQNNKVDQNQELSNEEDQQD